MKSPKHFTDAPMLTLAMAAMIGIHSIRRHSQVYRHVSRCSSAVRFGGLGLAFQEVGLTARRGQKPSGMGRGGSRHASTLCCCNRSDFGIEGHLCTPKHKYCEHSIKVSAHNPLPPSLSLTHRCYNPKPFCNWLNPKPLNPKPARWLEYGRTDKRIGGVGQLSHGLPKLNIGALTIRIGFWGPSYYNYNKGTPKMVLVII